MGKTSVLLVPVLLALVAHHFGGLYPCVQIIRNVFFPPVPIDVVPVHGNCSDEMLAEEMTIVVSVKDSCSQGPAFIKALETFAPKSVHLIYTFPNFTVCSELDYGTDRWDKVTMLPLPIRSSPMQGWVDAVPHIKTKYAMLLHNDGYALDSFFGCELLRGLKDVNAKNQSAGFVVSAPMLYESKHDGSLAAHATQSNLRIVKDESTGEVTVRHDHSLERALNRGFDFEEGDQSEFLEDHGFLIETDKIGDIVDPMASFTLEYIDMIMTIRSNNWKVLFVPSARLEFRITEFSWRDIPYFVYKRSEITAHGTRDYLSAKWKALFPNTGFWTFIKYTIVEQHVYGVEDITAMGWKDQAALAFGWFQMVGYNRYMTTARTDTNKPVDFLSVLENLDNKWVPEATVTASRHLKRPEVTSTKATKVTHLSEILPYGNLSFPRIEADLELEYLPFATAHLTMPGQCKLEKGLEKVCGLAVQHPDSCSCWINLPTFKSNSWYIRLLNQVAGYVKIPSRATTYLEMVLGSSRSASLHVEPLRKFEPKVSLSVCESSTTNCSLDFDFSANSKLVQYVGRPFSAHQIADVLNKVLA